MKKILTTLFLLSLFSSYVPAQSETNYDESKVPMFVLSPLLINEEGRKVTTPKEWEEECRPEILALLTNQEYGTMPEGEFKTRYEVIKSDEKALGGLAKSKQIIITFSKEYVERPVTVLIYLPKQVKGKVPVFLSYNFDGNQTIHNDPNIVATSGAERGAAQSRWPIEKILKAGYGVVTADYNQVFPDNPEGYSASVLRLFGVNEETEIKKNDGQAICAWAWGLSRMMDYMETDPDIDAGKVVLMGHSRQGKAALWAGAQDKRFAIVISNESGCGGAALSKRCFGETIDVITTKFPHWFCKNFRSYANNEQSLPFDQHELLALIAPRPLYVASAEEDRWADPKGEFLSVKYASEVYQLYGYEGITVDEMPPVNKSIMNRVGYHIRTGKHDVTEYDWEQYLKFASANFK